MRQIINILILGILLMSCESKKTNSSAETIANSDTTSQTFSIVFVEPESKTDAVITEKCGCSDFDKFKNHHNYHEADLYFTKGLLDKNKSDSIFNVYSADSLRLTIKSIGFSSFDTIPEKFTVFKNVEHIVFGDTWNRNTSISALDMFPNLKSICFEMADVDINSSDRWLSRIEGLYAGKSHIKGLSTFKVTPNLKDIYFAYSTLEPFPADFDKLKCLRRITLGAYTSIGKEVNLSKIDLALNPCLERVEFHTWYNNVFSGIPQGLDTNRTFELIVHHEKLTKDEKEIIKRFNERNKKVSP